uniref:Ig-like domain-containing protein n=1 Tax=Amphiprion ocellaris TaxID=80972 RepID=A0AAQ5WXF5_AMPOC
MSIALFSLYLKFLFLLLVSSSEVQASPNTNATLPCNVTLPVPVKEGKIDKSLITVRWISNGSDIALFGKAATQIKEGFSWDTTDFINGDFSLTVLKASLDLQGVYECTVVCCVSSDLSSVRLSVVPPSSKNTPLTLYCDVESFYPEEVSVSWFQNGTSLPEPPVPEQNPDGTYRTRRYYTLNPEQRGRGGKVECSVNQPGAANPVLGSAYLDKLDPQGMIVMSLFNPHDHTKVTSSNFLER